MFGKDSNKIHGLPIGVTGALWQQLQKQDIFGYLFLD
jgi:hypothetical protein